MSKLACKLSRRALIRAAGAVILSNTCARLAWAAPARRVRFTDYPFKLGVASGCPRQDGVVLWTRLAPDPLHDGGMEEDSVAVRWEVAEDERFARLVQHGDARASPELAHSVHVEVSGLGPDRVYYYRFIAGDEVSSIGRTRTLPGLGARSLRLALASCQHFEQGYFSAYRHMRADEPHLVVFVGDYIYESSWGDDLVRRFSAGEPYDLAAYRNRHAQYKLDPDLSRMHAEFPWLMTIDDHEVDNDFAGDQSEHLDPQFAQRRAAALQAYFEHMPLAWRSLPAGSMRLYDHYDVGGLARIYLLDDRQFRDPQPCPRAGEGGSNRVSLAACPALDAQRTLLGADQERWLQEAFASSEARWNILAQQTLVATLRIALDEGEGVWTDGWDGYPRARARLLAAMESSRLDNPVVLGGDYHCTWAADLIADDRRNSRRVVASELCGTSISSQGLPQEQIDRARALNAHVHYGNSSDRGYLLLEIEGDQVQASLRAVSDVKKPESAVTTPARFLIESGRPGVHVV